MDIPIPTNPWLKPASYALVLLIGLAIGWVGSHHYYGGTTIASTTHGETTNKDGSTNLERVVGPAKPPTDIPKNNTPVAGLDVTVGGGKPVLDGNVMVGQAHTPKAPTKPSQGPVVAGNTTTPTDTPAQPDASTNDDLSFQENSDGSIVVSPGLLKACNRILRCPSQHLIGEISTDKSGQTDVTLKDTNGNPVTGTITVPKTVKTEDRHPVLVGVSYGQSGLGGIVGYQFKAFPITVGAEVHKDDTPVPGKNNIDGRLWATWSF